MTTIVITMGRELTQPCRHWWQVKQMEHHQMRHHLLLLMLALMLNMDQIVLQEKERAHQMHGMQSRESRTTRIYQQSTRE